MLPGTWVNEVRLPSGIQWELSDGDTLTFGSQSAPGSSEFYFLFQKVRVRPLDFDAITIPKVTFFFFPHNIPSFHYTLYRWTYLLWSVKIRMSVILDIVLISRHYTKCITKYCIQQIFYNRLMTLIVQQHNVQSFLEYVFSTPTGVKWYLVCFLKNIFMLFPRWVHFPQIYKTASEPIQIEKWPLIWTCQSCPSTGPQSSLILLAAWVRWKVSAGPSRGATATRGLSQILAYHLHLCWLRASLSFLRPSPHLSFLPHQHNQQSAISQCPEVGGSLLTQFSLKMTAQMSHIFSEVRPGKTFPEITHIL